MNTPDITSSLLAKICYAAGRSVFGKLRRLELVQAAYDRPSGLPSPVRMAVADIRTIIGRQGLLTTQLHDFLTALEHSGLVVQMGVVAITGIRPQGTKLGFRLLFEKHFSDDNGAARIKSENADQLFDNLVSMLKASIINQNSVEATEFKDSARFETLVDNAMRLEVGLRERFLVHENRVEAQERDPILHAKPWLVEDPQRVRTFVHSMAKSLVEVYHIITVEGPNERSWPIELEEIYVESPVSRVELMRSPNVDRRTFHDFDIPVSIDQFLGELDKAVILGDPGGGKSTLHKRFA